MLALFHQGPPCKPQTTIKLKYPYHQRQCLYLEMGIQYELIDQNSLSLTLQSTRDSGYFQKATKLLGGGPLCCRIKKKQIQNISIKHKVHSKMKLSKKPSKQQICLQQKSLTQDCYKMQQRILLNQSPELSTQTESSQDNYDLDHLNKSKPDFEGSFSQLTNKLKQALLNSGGDVNTMYLVIALQSIEVTQIAAPIEFSLELITMLSDCIICYHQPNTEIQLYFKLILRKIRDILSFHLFDQENLQSSSLQQKCSVILDTLSTIYNEIVSKEGCVYEVGSLVELRLISNFLHHYSNYLFTQGGSYEDLSMPEDNDCSSTATVTATDIKQQDHLNIFSLICQFDLLKAQILNKQNPKSDLQKLYEIANTNSQYWEVTCYYLETLGEIINSSQIQIDIALDIFLKFLEYYNIPSEGVPSYQHFEAVKVALVCCNSKNQQLQIYAQSLIINIVKSPTKNSFIIAFIMQCSSLVTKYGQIQRLMEENTMQQELIQQSLNPSLQHKDLSNDQIN